MKGTRGIAGKTFTAVAEAGVNVVAIAQGSSELNISLVVEQPDARKAVQAIHDAFHLA
jgi:aspartokinase